MTYKVLVLKNRVKVNVDDDFQKAKEYISRYHEFGVQFDFKETDIPVETSLWKQSGNQFLFGTSGTREKIKDMVSPEYHCVIFAWDKMESPITQLNNPNIQLTSWSHWERVHPTTEYIELVTAPYDDQINHIYNSIIHELEHSFVKRANRRGANILDVMDTYIHNNDPEHIDGNFARQRAILAPHTDKILYMPTVTPVRKYKYFSDKELAGLQQSLIDMIVIAREIAQVPFILSGVRTVEQNKKAGGVEDSAHLTGYAVDITVQNDVVRYKILTALLQAGFTRIGVYKGHIHADNDPNKAPNVIWWK